jgi:hypothetical protein
MMSSGLAVQVKGLGASLPLAGKRLMAAEPGAHLGVLVDRIVVENGADDLRRAGEAD